MPELSKTARVMDASSARALFPRSNTKRILLLIESLVLAAAGGAAGLMLAAWGIQALRSLAPSDLPRLIGIHVDAPVILYASLAALVTGLIFGTAPALQSAGAAQHGIAADAASGASAPSSGSGPQKRFASPRLNASPLDRFPTRGRSS
jgi:hypothetical protein